MVTTLAIQPEYGYVVLTAASTFFLGFWHGARCGGFRKAAGPTCTYPAPYADSAMLAAAPDAETKKAMHLWNCAQRAHANFLENYPSFIIALLIAGVQYPIASTVCGAGWSLARIAYAVGYTDPKKPNGKGRLVGLPMWLFQIALYGMSGVVGYKIAFN